MILVDVDDRVAREAAAGDRQESGGEYLAVVAAEHDSPAVGHAQRRAGASAAADIFTPRGAAGRSQRIPPPFQHITAVVGGFGRLDRVRFGLRVMPEPFKDSDVFFRRDPDLFDPAADRDEEEDRPDRDPFPFEHFGDRVDQRRVAACDRRVHLNRQVQVPRVVEHLHRLGETAAEPAERVVDFRVRTVDAQADRRDARLFGASERVEGRQGGRARRERRGDSVFRGAGDQVEQVGPLERVAAGEADGRFPLETRHLADQRQRVGFGKLVGRRIFLRRGAAVLADQVARPRDLVVEHQRMAVEVRFGIGLVVHGVARSLADAVHSALPAGSSGGAAAPPDA